MFTALTASVTRWDCVDWLAAFSSDLPELISTSESLTSMFTALTASVTRLDCVDWLAPFSSDLPELISTNESLTSIFAALTASVTSWDCVDWLAAFSMDWIRIGIMSTAWRSVSPEWQNDIRLKFYYFDLLLRPFYIISIIQSKPIKMAGWKLMNNGWGSSLHQQGTK